MQRPELPSLDDLKEMEAPHGTAALGIPLGDPKVEWRRSDPDIVVYLPESDEYTGDNEHFNVFPSPKGDELLALWNQSSMEGNGDNHLVLARSRDGVRWTEPKYLAGPRRGEKGLQASWGFPVVSRKGRLYVFYTKERERVDYVRTNCGAMGCLYSDDDGVTWTHGTDIPMPKTKYDNPDPEVPRCWIVWQVPIRDKVGRVLAGYTVNTSKTRYTTLPPWWNWENRAYFMRFENIDENPAPEELEITWLPDDEDGLAVPNRNVPKSSFASEPAPALLPDGRLFTTMRTMTGYAWYSVSEDDGATWRAPEVMRYKDGGEPVPHPLSPCPIYRLKDGRYIFVYHNNDGTKGSFSLFKEKWETNQLNFLRNPTFISVGHFRPGAHQPIWFSRPKQILDTGGVPVGPKGTAEIATYTSLTEWQGTRVLWYPDRKYYLLGKFLPDELLADMTADEK